MKDTLKDFRIFLKQGGILYLSLRVGSANVMEMEDLGGKRFFTLYRKKEIETMVTSVGFQIVWSAESEHTDPALPGWFSLVAKRL
jgi:hypothetical protein